MQQQALGQLQAGLIDELESKGTFQDPETQKIMEKYQKVPVICFSKGVRRWKKLKPKDWIRGILGLISKVIPKLFLDSRWLALDWPHVVGREGAEILFCPLF